MKKGMYKKERKAKKESRMMGMEEKMPKKSMEGSKSKKPAKMY